MNNLRATGIRWLKFNAVGGIGVIVQLACLAVLTTACHVDYLLATALAVEAAVLHNFLWHERFTWADRGRAGFLDSLTRLAKFNVTTGVFSMAGNVVFMRLFVGLAHLPFILANLASIAACSLANFVVSDRVVFRPAER
jgi:putative flippase GtrA